MTPVHGASGIRMQIVSQKKRGVSAGLKSDLRGAPQKASFGEPKTSREKPLKKAELQALFARGPPTVGDGKKRTRAPLFLCLS